MEYTEFRLLEIDEVLDEYIFLLTGQHLPDKIVTIHLDDIIEHSPNHERSSNGYLMLVPGLENAYWKQVEWHDLNIGDYEYNIALNAMGFLNCDRFGMRTLTEPKK